MLQTSSRAEPQRYRFTQLDMPGATGTIPSGINAAGEVVGWYTHGGVTRGFTYRRGAFTTGIVYPGASFTQLRGIAPGGDIVGSYRNPGEPTVNLHGFVLTTHGTFIPVNFPGHTNHISQRILPDGTILGCLHDGDQMATMQGVQISRMAYVSKDKKSSTRGYSSIDAFASMTNGGTPDGKSFTGLSTERTLQSGEKPGSVLRRPEQVGHFRNTLQLLGRQNCHRLMTATPH